MRCARHVCHMHTYGDVAAGSHWPRSLGYTQSRADGAPITRMHDAQCNARERGRVRVRNPKHAFEPAAMPATSCAQSAMRSTHPPTMVQKAGATPKKRKTHTGPKMVSPSSTRATCARVDLVRRVRFRPFVLGSVRRMIGRCNKLSLTNATSALGKPRGATSVASLGTTQLCC